ncbi:MAG: tetratricopeptide repeat protein [Alphaproteobacteria bacterium]|jgi:hypothetical protein|nr:tetratricopeptide repeat protein [Alphaproteobacteria bacterium]MBT4710199.1 tetratricopeptide repeat protein [Alphaproteobacteria bacterium]
MSEIFREVDEDVRKDQALRAWSTYGRYLIGGALAIVLATAAFQFWIYTSTSQKQADGEKFVAAISVVVQGRPALAAEQFAALAQEAGAGIATMSRLQRAAAMAQSGDPRGAVAVYDQITEDSGAEQTLRDLARLLAAQHLVQIEPRAVIDERLAPLVGPANPWRFSAIEISGLAALKAGDTAAARESFERLADDQLAPQGIRSRAAELLAALGDEG